MERSRNGGAERCGSVVEGLVVVQHGVIPIDWLSPQACSCPDVLLWDWNRSSCTGPILRSQVRNMTQGPSNDNGNSENG